MRSAKPAKKPKLIRCPDCGKHFRSVTGQRKHATVSGCRHLKIIQTPKGYSTQIVIEEPF
jgi:hypothetical protein